MLSIRKALHLVLLFFPLCLMAQEIELFAQFNGRYDYTAIGNTLNTQENGIGTPCTILTESSANLTLLPGQTFVAAVTYWAGSGNGDFDVELNGIDITADRVFNQNFNGLSYFAAYADVTAIVGAAGNGTYTMSELDLTGVIGDYCGGATNFGGWTVIVIYEDLTLPLNQINLFDGLEAVWNANPNLTITLENIDVLNDDLAKIGFLAWEGDSGIAVNETLSINGVVISNPPLNPANNAFNGTNSFTNSSDLYNMDLDFYDIENVIDPGDTSVTINLTSGQDLVIVNNVITIINSEVPDATIVIDNVEVICGVSDITVDYTVFNVNSTAILPGPTPIAFYANGTLVGQTQTVADIAIGGSESGTITLTIPVGIPSPFTLTAVVDDDGTGTGVVLETDEGNNEFEIEVEISPVNVDLGPDINTCNSDDVILDASVSAPGVTYQWFFNGALIPGENNPTLAVSWPNSGTYEVIVTDGGCDISDEIEVTFLNQPVIANPPQDLFMCDDGNNAGIFDLTENDDDVLGGQNPGDFVITYYNSLADAEAGTNPINPPNDTAYLITGISETICVRIEDTTGACYATACFEISFFPVEVGEVTPDPYVLCDQDESGDETINLSFLFNAMVLNGQDSMDFIITYHESQADADAGTGILPNIYVVSNSPETLFVRFVNVANSSCFDSSENFDIVFDLPPPVNDNPLPTLICDDDNDGFALFPLEDDDLDIRNGDATLTLSFHETLLNAENNLLPLASPHPNNVAYNDIVYVRVESPSSSCYNVVILDLEVRNTPIIEVPVALRLCDINNPGDGIEVFDLTQVESEVLDGLDAIAWDFYYYFDEADAIIAGDLALGPAPDFSLAFVNPALYPNGVPNMQTIYILVVGNSSNISPNNGGLGCYNVVPLELYVDPLPVVFEPTDRYEVCDDRIDGVSSGTDGFSSFDLTTFDSLITIGDPDLVVTWYETPSDEALDIAIIDPTDYRNAIINEQTIVARVTTLFGCRDTVLLTLRVLPNPTPAIPDPLEVCDDDNDGFGEFDLSLKDLEIIGGEPDVSIEYYGNEILAEQGDPGNVIVGVYENDDPFIDSVWARVENNLTDCYTLMELILIVNPLPDAPTADFGDLLVCDDNGDTTAIFDLTENESFVLGDQTPGDFLPIRYYTDLTDAQTPTNDILSPTSFSSAGQTIWVRIENMVTGCYLISSFELVVGALPAIGAGPFTMDLCDDMIGGSTGVDGISTFDLTDANDGITLSDLSLAVFYYESSADQAAGTAIDPDTAYQNTNTPQTLQVSVFSLEGCENRTEITLTVIPNPSPVTPTPLEVCDDDNDGFADFTLSDKDDEIIGGEANIIISYYGTQELAEIGDPLTELDDPYENDDAFNDSVWARVESDITTGGTGCVTVIELELIVNLLPSEPTDDFGDLVECDDDGSLDAVFDLTENEAFVIGTQDLADFLPITYYTSLGDAEIPDNNITGPTSFTSSGQTIWVRIENIATGCYRISSFDLVVGVLPSIGAGPFSMDLCDDMIGGSSGTDQTSTFNLAENNDGITLSDISLSVFYYESSADQAAGNAIDPDTAYQNTSTPQVLQVSVFSPEGCEVRTILTLTVLNNPSPVTPSPLEVCDDDDDGFAAFTLTAKDLEIIGGELNVVVTYFLSEALAIEGDVLDELGSPHTNLISFVDMVWARASYTGTGCYTVVPLELIVRPVPGTDVELSDEIDCQVPFVGTNSIILSLKDPEVLNGQNPSVFEVYYFEDQADADGMNLGAAISSTTPYFYNTTERTIYVGILNTDTGCYASNLDFLLVVQEGVTATTPSEPYSICDNDGESDGIGVFDLLTFDGNITGINIRDEILGGQDPAIYTLNFYATFDQADQGDVTMTLSNTYFNVINPQIIYARVTNSDNTIDDKCYEIVEVRLKVEELPVIDLEDSYRLCVDESGDPIEQEDGEDSPPVIDTGLSASQYAFVWELDGGVLFGEIGSSIVAIAGGTYRVTVTEIDTGCSNTASTEVTVSSPPLVYSAEVVSGAFAINQVIYTDTSGVENTYTGTHVVYVQATGLGEYVQAIDDGPFQEGDVFVDVQPGTHVVTIKDVNGCGSVEVIVNVIDYPEFFTPNQDTYHDTWNIIGIAEGDPTAKIYIFDRFGKLLKQISPLGSGWDGTYNGKPLPSSDYWFTVEYSEDNIRKEFKGHFTLKR